MVSHMRPATGQQPGVLYHAQTDARSSVAIQEFFKRFMGKDSVQDLTVISQFEDYLAIETSNRYFTPRRQGTLGVKEISFSTDVDPHGFLANAAGNGFRKGDETRPDFG